MIRNSINRLDGFIKNILNYSRNNRTELEVERIPLQQTVNEIVDSLLHMKEAEGIAFEVNILELKAFYSDKQRFTTLLVNLISNAIKYHKKDVPGRYIKIKGNVEIDHLSLWV